MSFKKIKIIINGIIYEGTYKINLISISLYNFVGLINLNDFCKVKKNHVI